MNNVDICTPCWYWYVPEREEHQIIWCLRCTIAEQWVKYNNTLLISNSNKLPSLIYHQKHKKKRYASPTKWCVYSRPYWLRAFVMLITALGLALKWTRSRVVLRPFCFLERKKRERIEDRERESAMVSGCQNWLVMSELFFWALLISHCYQLCIYLVLALKFNCLLLTHDNDMDCYINIRKSILPPEILVNKVWFNCPEIT